MSLILSAIHDIRADHRNDLDLAFFAIVDLLAILPFYIEVALNEDTVGHSRAL